jgi:hypothetical protein
VRLGLGRLREVIVLTLNALVIGCAGAPAPAHNSSTSLTGRQNPVTVVTAKMIGTVGAPLGRRRGRRRRRGLDGVWRTTHRDDTTVVGEGWENEREDRREERGVGGERH